MDNHVLLLAVAGGLALVTIAGAIHEHLAADPNRRRRLEEPAMVRLSLLAAIARTERRAARKARRRG